MSGKPDRRGPNCRSDPAWSDHYGQLRILSRVTRKAPGSTREVCPQPRRCAGARRIDNLLFDLSRYWPRW